VTDLAPYAAWAITLALILVCGAIAMGMRMRADVKRQQDALQEAYDQEIEEEAKRLRLEREHVHAPKGPTGMAAPTPHWVEQVSATVPCQIDVYPDRVQVGLERRVLFEDDGQEKLTMLQEFLMGELSQKTGRPMEVTKHESFLNFGLIYSVDWTVSDTLAFDPPQPDKGEPKHVG
jgi:hypothetical protein